MDEQLIDRVAWAILTERIGEEGAARCREGKGSLAWHDARRYARAAIKVMEQTKAPTSRAGGGGCSRVGAT